jgi:hypothetical protein
MSWSMMSMSIQSASKRLAARFTVRPRIFPALVAVSPPIRMVQCSISLKQQVTRSARQRRQGHRAMSVGMNYMRECEYSDAKRWDRFGAAQHLWTRQSMSIVENGRRNEDVGYWVGLLSSASLGRPASG